MARKLGQVLLEQDDMGHVLDMVQIDTGAFWHPGMQEMQYKFKTPLTQSKGSESAVLSFLRIEL